MRIYKNSIKWTVLATTISLITSIVLDICICNKFWSNLFLGVFGSSLLSLIISIISYNGEKVKTLDNFFNNTIQIIKALERYDFDVSVEEKIDFFLNYDNYDFDSWDKNFRDIDLFFDKLNKSKDTIYSNIYRPLADFKKLVHEYNHNFRWHKNKTGYHLQAMKTYIQKIENTFIEINHLENEENEVASQYRKKMPENVCKFLCEDYMAIMYNNKKFTSKKENKNVQ